MAAVLAAGSLYGQEKPAATVGATAKPTVSAGLVNDWLRQQSDAMSAWDVGGQIRMRYEVFDNGPVFSKAAGNNDPSRDFQALGVNNDNAYFLVREKLHVGYAPTPWLRAFVEGRDSSSSGDDNPANPGTDMVDLHQAYVGLGDPKTFPVTLKVGRQELLYGDERLIGPSDWGNTGRVFDAAKVRYENSDIWVDGFVGRVVVPVDRQFNEPDSHDFFSGIYASSKTLVPIQESQVYVLSRNISPGSAAGTSARDIYTFGTRVKSLPGKLKGWDYTGELAWQAGSISSGGTRLTQEAMASSVGGGYTFTKAFGTPRVGVEYNYSSGDGDGGADGKSETFDNLFPTNHKHYGYMDFVGWRNVHNPRLMFSLKPAKSLLLTADYHLFWLANAGDSFYPQAGGGRSGNGYGKNAGYSPFVGSELDLDVTYNVTSWAAFRGGYGHFFKGEYIDQSKATLGGAVDADWVYLQATINF